MGKFRKFNGFGGSNPNFFALVKVMPHFTFIGAMFRLADPLTSWPQSWSFHFFAMNTIYAFFFLISYNIWWHTLPSHASAEACLTGWPNAQPQWRDWCSNARHNQASLMVCVVCCCATSAYREVCRAKGGIGSGEILCHDIYPARPITTVSLATNTYCMMDGHSSCAPRTVGPRVQFSGACEQSHWWPARHTEGGHLLSVVQAATDTERLWTQY